MKSMVRRGLGLLVAGVAFLGGTGLTVAADRSLVVTATGFYSVPYGPDLYYFLDAAVSTPSVRKATYDEWAASGFPKARPASTRYVKTAWSPTVFAVHDFTGVVQRGQVVHPLSYVEWQGAGAPAPAIVPVIPGSTFSGYSASPQIDVTVQGETHTLTLSEWLGAGMPSPRIVGWKPGSELVRYVTSYPEIFAVAGDGSGAHRLAYAEWSAWGFPPFRSTQAEGYYALSWAPEGIAYEGEDLSARQVTYAQWVAADYPSPRLVEVVDGDHACFDRSSGAVVYSGSTWSGTMTYDEATRRFSVWGMPDC